MYVHKMVIDTLITDRLLVPSSSPPTDSGCTFSSASVDPHERAGSVSPHNNRGNRVQQLIHRIQTWTLRERVFGSLLNEKEFPILYDQTTVSALLLYQRAS